jgi:hypothetical protein
MVATNPAKTAGKQPDMSRSPPERIAFAMPTPT